MEGSSLPLLVLDIAAGQKGWKEAPDIFSALHRCRSESEGSDFIPLLGLMSLQGANRSTAGW